MKKKYTVIRPWFGVTRGQVIEVENLHPAILPNVEEVLTVEEPEEEEEEKEENPRKVQDSQIYEPRRRR